MIYKNILGKDFKKKDEAYKYFRKKINEFDTRSHIVMTEETPVRQSDMKQLEKDYGSISDRATAKKSSFSDYQWCVEYLEKPFPSLALGIIENSKIEAFNARNLFKCFGPGTFNLNKNLEEALRYEIRPQIEEYRKMYRNSHICAHCHYQFPAQELEVDHVYPFAKIKKEFLKLYGKEFIMNCLYKEGAVHRLDDLSPDEEVYPDSPREAWFDFHKERATYQMLCKNGKEGLPGCHPSKRMGRKIKFKALSGNKSPKM